MSFYANPVTPIKDVSKYFRKNEKDGSVTFIGKSLELRIPLKFKTYGALEISERVTTFGVMDMIFDDKYQTGLNLLAQITIVPSDMSTTVINNVEYLVLKLQEGDTFMTSSTVVKNPHVVYVLWSEFVTAGHPGYWLTYQDMLALFAKAYELTGSGIGVSRSVFEGIIAHIARSPTNISRPYRLTDMTKPMKLVALKSISQATSGTVSRLNGSYFRDEGLTSALRHNVDEQQPFENILRGIQTIDDLQ